MSVQAMAWVFESSLSKLGSRLVLLAIANHADRFGKNSYASVATLGEEAHLSVRQVQRCLRELEATGEIRQAGKHVHRPDKWTYIYEMPALADGVTIRHPAPPSGVTYPTERGDILDASGVTPVSPEPSVEPSEEPSTTIRALDDLFDEFWEVYPLHTSKAEAKKRFGLAVRGNAKAGRKAVDPAVILAGARRYRDDPNRDPSYTKHPTTWLNQGCWDDDPIPARRNGNGGRKRGGLDLDRMARELDEKRAARAARS